MSVEKLFFDNYVHTDFLLSGNFIKILIIQILHYLVVCLLLLVLLWLHDFCLWQQKLLLGMFFLAFQHHFSLVFPLVHQLLFDPDLWPYQVVLPLDLEVYLPLFLLPHHHSLLPPHLLPIFKIAYIKNNFCAVVCKIQKLLCTSFEYFHFSLYHLW